MRKKMYMTGLAVMCGLVLTATGLWASAASEAEPAAAAEREMVRDPATGQMILKPQYGGSIAEGWPRDAPHTDTWWGGGSREIVTLVLDKLGVPNWGTDRDEFDFMSFFTPESIVIGDLAESYEISPDGLTLTFHIRKGVHWQDKPPVNGRELVAEDIAFHFQRFMGQGDFADAEPSPHATSISNLPIESIEAPDRYTVVFKLSKPDFSAFNNVYYDSNDGGFIYPPEIIKQFGDAQDWRNLVGSGPYMLTDWVKDSAITYTKNPNYWRFDEKFPENRLPYLDEVKILVIPDASARMAALRTGKTARLWLASRDEGRAIQRTNPEILSSISLELPWTFAMDVRKPPFDDIRVRRAMQLALDLETINDTLFDGLGDTTPYGVVGPGVPGYFIPFEEWPQELKDNHGYDPERAKQLLAEAGYPNGFETKMDFSTANTYWSNLDYTQLAVDYWAQIGVDVEIDTMEMAVLRAHFGDHTYEGMTYGMRGANWPPLGAIRTMAHSDSPVNASGVQDPVYDAKVEAAENAGSPEEMRELVKKADMYFAEQQWVTWGPTRPNYIFWQPWMVGYNGELSIGGGQHLLYLSRVWLDADLREEMTGTR